MKQPTLFLSPPGAVLALFATALLLGGCAEMPTEPDLQAFEAEVDATRPRGKDGPAFRVNPLDTVAISVADIAEPPAGGGGRLEATAIVRQPAFGAAALRDGGTRLLYSPGGFRPDGSDAAAVIVYRLAYAGAVSVDTVEVVVNAPPRAAQDTLFISGTALYGGQPVTISVAELLRNYTDPTPGEALNADAIQVEPLGTAELRVERERERIRVFFGTAGKHPRMRDVPAFRYWLRDSEGALSDTTLAVVTTNRAPKVVGVPTFTVAEDGVLTITAAELLAEGLFENEDRDRLRVARVEQQPAHGALRLRLDGSILYTPTPDYAGPDAFSYVVDDGFFLVEVVARVTVTPVNDAPVRVRALPDVTLVEGGEPALVSLQGLFADPDPQDVLVISTEVLRPGVVGVAREPGRLVLTPGRAGTTDVVVRAQDPAGAAAADTFLVTVRPPPNRPPTANPNAYVLDEDTELRVPADAGVLVNDGDLDGDRLLAVLRENVQFGTLQLGADGSFTYQPRKDFNGQDRFRYTATDGALESAPAEVILTVRPVNDAPVALPFEDVTTTETTYRISLRPRFTDADGGDVLIFRAASSDESVATAAVESSTLVLTRVAPGTAAITVTARDEAGAETQVTFTVTFAAG